MQKWDILFCTLLWIELYHWRKLLRVPWTARGSNQSILKEVNPEYSSEGLMLKLKVQYFSHLMWRTDSLEKTQMLGKIKGRRRSRQQRMRGLEGITVSADMSLSKLSHEGQGSLACCSPWGCKESNMTEQLNNNNQSNENQSYGRVPQEEEIWWPHIASDMAVFTDWREKSTIKE